MSRFSVLKWSFVAVGLLVALTILSCGRNKIDSGRPYLILYAFDAEGELLSREMKVDENSVILGRTVYSGRLAGQNIVLAESGVGMTNAAMTTQRIIDDFNPRAIIFSGIAGAIDTSVHIGDIVVCRQWQTHDYGYHGKDGFVPTPIKIYDAQADSMAAVTRFMVDSGLYVNAEKLTDENLSLGAIGERLPRLIVGGVGVSGNCFIDNIDKRLWLSDQFHALVTDMESAAVGQVSAVNNVPFIVFRSASDLAGGSGSATAEKEIKEFFNVAADNASRVVVKFLSEL